MDFSLVTPEILEIHRAERADGPYEPVGRTNGAQYGAYTDLGLTPGRNYYYKARIVKVDGRVGLFSDTQAAVTLLPAATWHWIRQGMEGNAGFAYINWSTWHDVDWAYVQRASNASGPYVNLDTLRINTDYKTAVPDKTQAYYYRLLPVKCGVEGAATEPVKVFFP